MEIVVEMKLEKSRMLKSPNARQLFKILIPKLNTRVRFPSPAPFKKAPKALIFKNFRGFFDF